MDIRTMLVFTLGLTSVAVLAMEGERPRAPRFEEIIKAGSSQDIHTLISRINALQSSIMFFVPKDTSQVPFIGYSSCSCQNQGLAENRVHKDVMVAMFKAVLAKLASKGFERVRFTAKLLQTPPCLSDFINDPKFVPFITREGLEIVISTQLPA